MNACARVILVAGAVVVLTTEALAGDAPTYTEDVAPIFMANCVVCHRPGEVAPMSLLTYDEARPWAKSIRKAVAERVMPPWDAHPAHGKFANDISLDQSEIDTIVAWVEANAPQGPPDAMPDPPQFSPGWKLGEPDFVVDLGAFDIPAAGEDLFITRAVRLNLPEERWLRAVEVQPGNRKVLHHLVAFKGYLEMGGDGQNLDTDLVVAADERREVSIVSIWAAGSPPTVFPEGMGHPCATDQLLSFNIHYHPYGEAATDNSKIGLYFGNGAIQKEITTGFAMNTGIAIAPESKSEEFHAVHVFGRDSKIISFFPHMHQRGRSMRYDLTTPDGATKTLLDVAKYDFNWQWIYQPANFIDVPAGARVDVYGTFDNTAENPGNPDPTQQIYFGEGSNAEMLIGFFEYIPAEGVRPRPYRTQDVIGTILAPHPADETYRLDVKTGFATIVWGMHLPRDGAGTFYLLDGTRMATISIDDVTWHDDGTAVAHMRFFEDVGRPIPMTVYIELSDSQTPQGAIYIGEPMPETPNLDEARLRFTGQRMDLATK